MMSLAKNIVLQRWDNLPQNLRDVLCSEENAIILQKIAQDEHLPPNKFKDFSRIAGYVILGFIHPEDLARNLEENLHLPPQTTKNMQSALLNNIFNTYKTDLDKIYKPLGETDFGLTSDRRKEDRVPTPAFMNLSANKPVKLKIETSAPSTKAGSPPIPSSKTPIPTPATTPKPAPSPFVMGNRPLESKPIITPREFRVSSSIPTPQRVSLPTPSPSRPARVELGKMNEEVKFTLQTKDVGREPIRYSSPKNIFMPQAGNTKPIPPAPPKINPPPAPPTPSGSKSFPPVPPVPTK